MDREREQDIFKKYKSLLESRKEEKLIDKCLWLEASLSKYTKDRLQLLNTSSEYIKTWETYLLFLSYCDLIYSNTLGYSISSLLSDIEVVFNDKKISLDVALAIGTLSFRLFIRKSNIVPEEIEKLADQLFEWREIVRRLVLLNNVNKE